MDMSQTKNFINQGIIVWLYDNEIVHQDINFDFDVIFLFFLIV